MANQTCGLRSIRRLDSTVGHINSNLEMSQRRGNNRDRARNTGQGNGEEHALWNEIRELGAQVTKLQLKCKDISEQIIRMEEIFKSRLESDSIKPSPDELQTLENLYRSEIKATDDIKSLVGDPDEIDSLKGKITILHTLVSHNEQDAVIKNSNSRDRTAMDLDGSMDSPGPPAENKQIRKLGPGRPNSQPPRDKEKDTAEPSEPSNPTGRTKITFALGADVAFKPKVQNQTEDHDWIQGIVVKVIGEGKSRRYDVQDPFPDEAGRAAGTVYRSSASSMVPIPPVGAPLGDYEVGKNVLALYPDTTTFYRAVVKGMADNGTKVQLLFEGEEDNLLKLVDRRFVLDHKG